MADEQAQGATQEGQISSGDTEGQAAAETPNDEASHPAVEAEKKLEWTRLGPGELPKAGELAICRDGEGKIEWVHGPNVQLRLTTGYIARTGIDGIRVKR